MSKLEGLEPKEVLGFFEELSAIPHGSGNTKGISDYCVAFAKDRGLEVIQDKWNNIIITKEATSGYEEEDTIILQGHLDMVCEKKKSSDFNFSKDGLCLETDGTWIWAQDTTLGGDDGIAIAMSLAILDSKEILHPKIEAVFTVDEEIGLIGASAIDVSSLTGKKLINIDSEDDSQILVSCAGGVVLKGYIPVVHTEYESEIYEFELHELEGGHSGAEIHKGRGNSNVLMGRILHAMGDRIEIVDVNGGNAHNVIPNSTQATFMIDACYDKEILSELAEVVEEVKREYILTDGKMESDIKCLGVTDHWVLDTVSKRTLLQALMNLPNGVQAMSASIPDLVETSLNMGIVAIRDGQIELKYNIRSSKESAKHYLKDRTVAMIEYMGGHVEISGDYPGWEYRVDSPLRESVVKVYTNLFSVKPHIRAIHAGLECGLFVSKIKGLDCVSIGPNIREIHSINEKMEVSSVERVWNLLLGVLAEKNIK